MSAFLKTWFSHALRVDWRVWVVFASSLATLVATCVVYLLGWGLDPSTHFGAIFASWVSGVVLFVVVGSVIALVSLARPERESFDSRARILFRRQTGKHIDYIITKITEAAEHYAERTVIRISIRNYDEATQKYRISSASDIVVRSYLDDIETTYNSYLGLKGITLAPEGKDPNRLLVLRVAGKAVGMPEDFEESISRPLSCKVEADGSCEISSVTEFWVRADEEANVHRPRRYTQLLTLHFENLISSGQTVALKVSRDAANWVTEQLPHGTSKQVIEVRDVKPDEIAYDFRILKP
jgi:hypothetical protein